MPTGQQTFDSLTTGTVPTTMNLSGSGQNPSLVSISAGDAITADSGRLKFVVAGPGAGATRVMFATAEPARLVLSTEFEYSGALAVEDVMGFRSASANVADLHVGSDGKVVVYNTAGSGIVASIATAALPTGAKVRIDFAAKPGTTTTDGYVGYAVFLNGATTPSYSWESSAQNTGTAAIATSWVGRGTGRTVARTMYHDTVRWQTLTSGWLAAPTAPTATVGITLDTVSGKLLPGRQQAVQATVNDTGGQVTSLDFTQLSGPAVTFTGTGNSRTYTVPPSLLETTVRFRVAAKNSAGTELAFNTVTHTVAPSELQFYRAGELTPAAVVYSGAGLDLTYPTTGTTPTVPPVIVDPTDTRPTGSQYVAIESLGGGAYTNNPRGALENYAGAGKILTLPKGTIEVHNWNAGNAGAINVENGWRGLVGSGRETIIKFAADMVKITPPTSGTNPYHTVQVGVTSRKALEVGNFSLIGNAGHAHGGARISADLNSASETVRIWKMWLDNAAPGYSNSPPGETFGINLWRSSRSLMEDITVEGRNNSSSAIGYNNADNTVTKRVYSNECVYGMPTWWKCTNIYSEDITSLGGDKGINMENVGGDIKHYRLVLRPNRSAHPNAMHSTLQSNQSAYVASRVEFHDFTVDTGLKGGCFMLMSSKNYTVAGGDGGSTTQLQVPSRVHVYRRDASGNEYELTMQDTAAGTAAPDTSKYWYLYR